MKEERIKKRMEGRRRLEKALSRYSWYKRDLKTMQDLTSELPAKIKEIEENPGLTTEKKEFRIFMENACCRGVAKTFRRKYGFLPGEPVRIVPFDRNNYSNPSGKVIFEIDPRAPLLEIVFSIETLIKTLFQKWKINDRLRPEERIKALQVYDLWERGGVSGRLSFPKIAKKLKTSVNTIKSRWRMGYKLHHGESYNPETFKKDRRDSALEICSKCKKFTCYKLVKTKDGTEMMIQYPCSMVLKTLKHATSEGYQREKTMTREEFELVHYGELID